MPYANMNHAESDMVDRMLDHFTLDAKGRKAAIEALEHCAQFAPWNTRIAYALTCAIGAAVERGEAPPDLSRVSWVISTPTSP